MNQPTQETHTEGIEEGNRPLTIILGFLFSPSSWLPQRYVTEHGDYLSTEQGTGFQLIRTFLDECRKDPGFRCALDQAALIRPFADLHPESMRALRDLVDDDRIEIVGKSATLVQSNLADLEIMLRNFSYGKSSHKATIGARTETGWLLDSMGHDPSLPLILNACGIHEAYLRFGVFHAAHKETENLPTHLKWIGPAGSGVRLLRSGNLGEETLDRLSHAHTLETVERALTRLTESPEIHIVPLVGRLRRPVTSIAELVRTWNKSSDRRQIVIDTPSNALAKLATNEPNPMTIGRLLGPVFTGIGVTHIDLKLAHRHVSNQLVEAELLVGLAACHGMKYSAISLDWAARALTFASHPEALAGSVCDQAFIDLLSLVRTAHDTIAQVRKDAWRGLIAATSTSTEQRNLVVFNSQAFKRTEEVSAEVPNDIDPENLRLINEHGDDVNFDIIREKRRIRFVARGIPSLGFCHYQAVEKNSSPTNHQPDLATNLSPWQEIDRPTKLRSRFLQIEVDPTRSGVITSMIDLRNDQELLRSRASFGANQIIEVPEYRDLPGHGSGLKHLTPKGFRTPWKDVSVVARIRHTWTGDELQVFGTYEGTRFTQSLRLSPLSPEIRFTTWIHHQGDSHRQLQIAFPFARLGRRPLLESRTCALSGPFCESGDVSRNQWTQDQLGYRWAGWAATLRVAVAGKEVAIGVVEVIYHEESAKRESLDRVMRSLFDRGVSSTPTKSQSDRMGLDSRDPHGPDLRLLLMTRHDSWPKQLGSPEGHFEEWPPRGDGVFYIEPDERCRLVVLLAENRETLASLIEDLCAAIDQNGSFNAQGKPPSDPLKTTGSLLLLNRGQQSYALGRNGDLAMTVLRATGAWPAGLWFDGPRRSPPEGSSFAMAPWSHRFEYSLLCGPIDPQSDPTCLSRIESWDRPLRCSWTNRKPKQTRQSFLTVEPEILALSAYKVSGTPSMDTLDDSEKRGTTTIRLVDRVRGMKTIRLSCADNLGPLAEAVRLDATETPIDKYSMKNGTLEIESRLGQIHTLAVRHKNGRHKYETVLGGRHPHSARYWDLNLGPVPIGSQPFNLALEPRTLNVSPGARGTVSALITHRRQKDPLEGTLTLHVPPSWGLARQKTRFTLAPKSHRRFRLNFSVPHDEESSWEMIRVQVIDSQGFAVDDFVAIQIGGPPERPTPFQVRLESRSVYLRPGFSSKCRVWVTNPNKIEMAVSLSLASSFSSWPMIDSARRRVRLAPMSSRLTELTISCPPELGEGHFFGVIKAVGGAHCLYTESFLIAPISTPRITLEERPTQIKRLEPILIRGEYASLEDNHGQATVGVRLPTGFANRVLERKPYLGSDGIYRIRFVYEVLPPIAVSARKPTIAIIARAPTQKTAMVTIEPIISPLLHSPRMGLARDTDDLLQVGMSSAEWAFASVKEDCRWRDRDGGFRVRVQSGWDRRSLYFVVETMGAVPFNDREGPEIFLGDCFRMAIRQTGEIDDSAPLDFVVALARGRAEAWCYSTPLKNSLGDRSWFRVDAERRRGGIRYAIIVSTQAIGLPKILGGKTLEFSFAAYTDSASQRREIAEWTPGMFLGRELRDLGSLQFVD